MHTSVHLFPKNNLKSFFGTRYSHKIKKILELANIREGINLPKDKKVFQKASILYLYLIHQDANYTIILIVQ